MEVGNGDGVPGITGHSACAETGRVIEDIGDDGFDEIQGKPGGRRRACHRGLRRSNPPRARSPYSNSSSVPNSADE